MKTDALEIERRMKRFKAAAKKAGLKLTHQRLEIFREVASSQGHPDAETAFRAVRERMPTVALETVYRTLWMLDDLGLIASLGPRRGSLRFDANLEPHHHFICVRCGAVRDVDSSELDDVRIPSSAKRLGRVVAARVEMKGVCRRCERARRSAPDKPKRP